MNVNTDVELTNNVFDGTSARDNRLYFATNELASEIIGSFDIKDKDVLTVLGSGDQAFHFYNNGARKVDVFDINRLAIYYYYLRRWTITYLKMSYPPFNFDGTFILDLLSHVVPRDDKEQNAILYWKEIASLLKKTNIDSKKLFHYSIYTKYDESIFDNTNLEQILNEDSFSFYNFDIARIINSLKKYDVVYVSNIADYVDKSGTFDNYKQNLKKLIKKDGIIICSSIAEYGFPKGFEKLKEDFIWHDIRQGSNLDVGRRIGYCYTKKRLKDRLVK